MGGIKTLFNTQWGRVLASLTSAVPSGDNEGREPSVTPQGAVWVAIDGTNPVIPAFSTKTYFNSVSILSNGLVFTGASDIITIFGTKNSVAALRYLQIFDAIALPVNGTVPKISVPLATANAYFSIDYPVLPQVPRQFTTGIYFAMSTTQSTLTLAATGLVWVNAEIGS